MLIIIFDGQQSSRLQWILSITERIIMDVCRYQLIATTGHIESFINCGGFDHFGKFISHKYRQLAGRIQSL